jgi:hypothetical protein
MSDEKQTEHSPGLKALVDRYQATQAPPGFAERVAAHVKEEKVSRAPLGSQWIYGASLAFVAVLAVLLMPAIFEKESELQIAQQEDASQIKQAAPAIQTTPQPEKVESMNNTETPPVVSPSAAQPARQNTQIAQASEEVKKEVPMEEKPLDDENFANVAVLSEVSDWLETDTVPATLELDDMPALSDIEELFNTT